MLSEKEFVVLRELNRHSDRISQRDLSDLTGYSLGTVNVIIQQFIKNEFISQDYTLLPKGRENLEHYRVKNAVILAAGITAGTNAISRSIPKGMYIVRGEVLIERQIRQLLQAGISDIYVVVGFRMDRFFYLEEKFGVHLIPSPDYRTENSSGSLYCVRNILGNSYILPNDEYFVENVFSQYEYRTYYASVYSEGKSKETFVELEHDDRISGISKGGISGWTMLGHCYMDKDYADNYIRWYEKVRNNYEVRKMFWEEILYRHLNEIPFYAKKYNQGVIYEFDELSELQGFDDQFINNINPDIYTLICSIFNSSRSEITGICPETARSRDIEFGFKLRNDSFIFRYPVRESAELISFSFEQSNSRTANENGIDDTFVFEDRRGYRISAMSDKILNYDISECIRLVKKLHDTCSTSSHFDFAEKIRSLYELFDENQRQRVLAFSELKDRIINIVRRADSDNWEKKFCHNDISADKFRMCSNEYSLTDWSFSGINDVGYDIAAISSAFSEDRMPDKRIISKFTETNDENLRHIYACQAVNGYFRFLLGIWFSESENEYSDNLYLNWKSACSCLEIAEKLYSQKQNEYLTNEQADYIEKKTGESIVLLEPLSGGVTNCTYMMETASGKKYAVRIPGTGTNEYISRKDEMNNIIAIDSLGIMPRVICADSETGILILDYIENCMACSVDDIYNTMSLRKICRTLHNVHSSGKKFDNEFDIPAMQNIYREHFREIGGKNPEILEKEEKRFDSWMSYLFLNYPKELVTCHVDPKLNNFLKKGRMLYLIDWEYSGMADCYFELANLALTNNLDEKEEKLFLDEYCRTAGIVLEREKYLLYKFATDYLWIYWHLIRCQEKTMVEYNEMSWKKRFKRAKHIIDKLEKEHEL